MLLMLIAAACTEAAIQPYTGVCENWTFEEGAEPVLEGVVTGDMINVRRNGIMMDCDASFAPEISADGRTINVFEAWVVPDEESDCEMCLAAKVDIGPVTKGTYTIQWFDESSDVFPVDTLVIDVD